MMAEGGFICGLWIFIFLYFSCVVGENTVNTIVPNILHQKWKRAPIPESLRQAYDDCQKHAKHFTYRLWTDEDVEEFISKEYPWFMKTFKSYAYDIQRIDVAKYFILYHYGGIYLDLDTQCKVDLSQILKEQNAHKVILAPTTPWGVATDVLMTPPRHPFFYDLIMNLTKTASTWYVFSYPTIMWSTGPMYVTNHLWSYKHQDQILILDKKFYKEIYFKNLHFSSWHRWDGVIIWNVYRIRFFILLTLCLIIIYKLMQRWRKSETWKSFLRLLQNRR